MSWIDWIPAIIEGIGLLKDKDNASSPTPVEPLDLEALARLMTINTQSPWGGMSYTQGDDGRYTAEYKLGATQPVFDNAVQRSLNPDQAYQMAPELQQLQQALMQQRLGAVGGAPSGVSPRPQQRPYNPGGGQFQGPFAPPAGSSPTTPPGQQTIPPRVQHGSEGNYGRTGEGGYAGARDAGYAPGMGRMGGNANGFDINNYLDRTIPRGQQQGWAPSEGQQWGLENAGHIGSAVGGLLGIPGLGLLTGWFGNNHMMNNPWQSPATNLPQTGNDMLNEAIDGRSSPSGEGGRGRGRGNLSGPAFGGGGGWYYDSSGQLKFSRSGHIRTHGS